MADVDNYHKNKSLPEYYDMRMCIVSPTHHLKKPWLASYYQAICITVWCVNFCHNAIINFSSINKHSMIIMFEIWQYWWIEIIYILIMQTRIKLYGAFAEYDSQKLQYFAFDKQREWCNHWYLHTGTGLINHRAAQKEEWVQPFGSSFSEWCRRFHGHKQGVLISLTFESDTKQFLFFLENKTSDIEFLINSDIEGFLSSYSFCIC